MNYRKAKAHDKLKQERIDSPRHFSQDKAFGIGIWKKPVRPPEPRFCAYRHCGYYKSGHPTACCAACAADMYEDMVNVITAQIQRALTSRGVPMVKALKIAALGVEAIAAGMKELEDAASIRNR